MRVDLETGDTSDVILYPNVLSIPFITDFERTATGGFAILGFYQNVETFLPYSSFIMNIDPDRNLNWFKEYNHLPIEESDQQWSQAYDIDLTPDSGFVVAGTWIDPSIDNRQAPWLFKIDGCGDLQWNNCTLSGLQETDGLRQSAFAFPNPAENIATVRSEETLKEVIWIDMSGKICQPDVIARSAKEMTFSTDDLNAGIYAVRLNFESGSEITLRVAVK
jgi:Secretion system C-terminal sorting domain